MRPYPRPGDVDDSGAWQDKGRGVWSGRLDLTLVDFGRDGSSFGGWVGLYDKKVEMVDKEVLAPRTITEASSLVSPKLFSSGNVLYSDIGGHYH